MKSISELNELMPRLLICDCDVVVMSRDMRHDMSRDMRLRCQRVQARFHAANNLACHGTSRHSCVDCGSVHSRTPIRRLGAYPSYGKKSSLTFPSLFHFPFFPFLRQGFISSTVTQSSLLFRPVFSVWHYGTVPGAPRL